MDRARFEVLLDAYGADFRRWPERERSDGEAFARAHPQEIAALVSAADVLDRVLDATKETQGPSAALTARVLATAPNSAPSSTQRRASFAAAGWALAACALLGVIVGYGAGTLAPSANEDAYYAAAFESPSAVDPGDGG